MSKNTEVDTIGSIFDISKGNKLSVVIETSNASRRLIGIDDLRNDNQIKYADDVSGIEALPEDVLIAWDGANAGTIGYGKNGLLGSTIARLRFIKKDKYYTPFIGAYLKSKFIYLRQTSIGATIPHINRKALEDIIVPKISFDDQKRIAHLLGKVEGPIAQRKQGLAQLDELLKSVFLQMFGDQQFDKSECSYVTLGSKAIIVSGVTKGKKYKDQKMYTVPYLRVANVQDGHLNLSEMKTIEVTEEEKARYQLHRGDLLLTEGGDLDKLGRGTLWNNEISGCIHQNHIFRVRLVDDSINPVFLSALVSSKYGKAYFLRSAKKTTGIASINSTQLKRFPLFLPSLSQQKKFATIFEKVEIVKIQYQQNLLELEKLYNVLSQKAFAGDLDLSRMGVVTNL